MKLGISRGQRKGLLLRLVAEHETFLSNAKEYTIEGRERIENGLGS